jgi:hypothetical protein
MGLWRYFGGLSNFAFLTRRGRNQTGPNVQETSKWNKIEHRLSEPDSVSIAAAAISRHQ